MNLITLLQVLAPKTFVRIKFTNSTDTICFATGKRRTGEKINELIESGKGNVKVQTVYPLYHAQELYILCYEC